MESPGFNPCDGIEPKLTCSNASLSPTWFADCGEVVRVLAFDSYELSSNLAEVYSFRGRGWPI